MHSLLMSWQYWKWFLRIDFEKVDNVMLSLLLGRKIFLGRMTIENQNQMNLNLSNHGISAVFYLTSKTQIVNLWFCPVFLPVLRNGFVLENYKNNINNIGIGCYICCICVFNYTSSHKKDCCYCQVLMYNHKKKHAFSFDMKYFSGS